MHSPLGRSTAATAATILVFSATAAFVAGVRADAPAPGVPGDTAVGQTAAAYRAIDLYHSRPQMRVQFTQNGWHTVQTADAQVALDRAAGRLLVSAPDMRLVVSQGKLRLELPSVSDAHYLEVDAPTPLTYEKMLEMAPVLEHLSLPDAVMLTAQDAWEVLSHGQPITTVDPAPTPAPGATPGDAVTSVNAASLPGLAIDTQEGRLVLRVDPRGHLIRRADMTVPISDTQEGTFSVTMDAPLVGQSIAADVFAFDTQGKTPVDSLQKLFQSGGVAGGGDDGGHRLLDQPAPPIDLLTLDGKPFSLAQAMKQHEVVVLDFWATWCPPCREALPKLQAVAQWARQNGKSVGIYTVNIQETPQQVEAFWKQQGFTLPVVMDAQGEASAAYGVTSIPQTVFIQGGIVRHVEVGAGPEVEATLKSTIEALLSKPGHAAAPSGATPSP